MAIRFSVSLLNLVKIRQVLEGPYLSERMDGHAPYLAVVIVFHSIQESRRRAHVAEVVEAAANLPADNP